MVLVREGIDKVMLTIREKKHHKYPFPKDVSLMYADRLKRLKFADRYAYVISFSKHPWSSWKYQGEDRFSFASEYFLRLDGMRQLRVLLNCMRLYNIKNELPLYKSGILFDDNVVIPSHLFSLSEFVDLMKKEIEEIKSDYIQMREVVFGDTVFRDQLVVDTHQVEVVQEGIGLDTFDVSQTFKDFARCQSIKVFHNQTNTHYFNLPGRRQLKIYQKGIGIMRLEATFNVHPKDVIHNWSGDTDHIVRSIQAEIDDLLEDMNIQKQWWITHSIEKDKLVWLMANALKLTDPTTKEVWVPLMKRLLCLKDWDSRRENRLQTQMLKRKKLIEPVMRGKYVPTENLLMIQELFNKLDRMKVYENEQR